MPIYEYQAVKPETGCRICRRRFEHLQGVRDDPLPACPACGAPVRKLISWCRAAVLETAEEAARTEDRIRSYEKEGLWSHAAELADKQAEKSRDPGLKSRALDNYEKAGYDPGMLARHDAED